MVKCRGQLGQLADLFLQGHTVQQGGYLCIRHSLITLLSLVLSGFIQIGQQILQNHLIGIGVHMDTLNGVFLF